MAGDEEQRRVLSIQSHVVSGYVGNKSATFPLQVLGFEVDAINSVQFCCHTGYKVWKGQVLQSQDLDTLFDGLKANGLHKHYTNILTGYVGSLSFLQKVYDVVKEVKENNPNSLYVCDPVMGDSGHMYVPQELLPFYRDNLMGLADVVTPNQFEAEILTGVSIRTEADTVLAMDTLHERGIPIVVVSSTDLGNEDYLVAIASRDHGQGQAKERFRFEIPRFEATFVGTGDLFAALLMAWLTITGKNLRLSCEKTISTMESVLKRTYESAKHSKGGLSVASLELKLIQSKKDIENPTSEVRSFSL
jgi:pyridoxine kinase